MMCSSFKTYIFENFNLNGISEVYFWKSEWEEFDPDNLETPISNTYLGYRFIFMLYFLSTLTQDFVCSSINNSISLWFIFLTNITYLVQVIYSVISFSIIFSEKVSQGNLFQANQTFHLNRSRKIDPLDLYPYKPKPLPFLYKLHWILWNVVTSVPFGVTLLYWSFLFKGHTGDLCSDFLNYETHALNSVIPFLDNLIVALPGRVTHFIFPVIYGIAYALFTIIYEVADGQYDAGKDYIYSIIDWGNKPILATGTTIGALVFVGLAHLILCVGVSKVRILIVQKIKS